MYDLILHNNGTKASYLYSGLSDSGDSITYVFEDFDIGDVPYGEYTYFLVWNELTGVTYTFKNVPLETLVEYGGTTYTLKDLNPEIGLMKYQRTDVEEPSYRDTDTVFYYRSKNQ